ncbi:ABC-F family ATP-binding cassette domain-containing protein [Legionella israelensis]|uniref:ABC-F family ATP-binding cassette domain-containing protein n=1 Tax=Legionella israelensis TaxID=454 RepID=A0AAX1ED58_9GAMM|nr:ATP-binding cassette domain-containing protein [Legionella israelensis]QBR83010.1 ABC-F family ATP-binding cassette domain-containing protein [Legionella israelensis]
MSLLCSIHQLSLIYPEKICFEQFDACIYAGQKIALIGDNGCGKTSLLRMIAGQDSILDGDIRFNQDIPIGYVPQIPPGMDGLSGAERFQKALSKALSVHPELLILDEPTNHLDTNNRKQLLQFLQYYPGTLLVASHDKQLLSIVPECLWSIKNSKVEQFDGQHEDFLREKEIQYGQLNEQLSQLEKKKRAVHHQLMKEQKRAKSAKEMGKKSVQNHKWPTIVSHAKMHRASMTSGKKRKQVKDKREDILVQMGTLDRPETIEPKFHLLSGFISHKSVVMIKDGIVGYPEKMLSHRINIQLCGQGRLVITGANGSGKSTLIKAIMNQSDVIRKGDWQVPEPQDIGYLDQHYQQLSQYETVLSTLETTRPDWTHQQIRSHLNDFLFKSNHVVNQSIDSLSGGEKARLSLAKIVAKPPKLLILDEMTNNLDVRTRNHVIQCLQQYPGAIIVISHDKDFLEQINIQDFLHLCSP